MRTVLHSRIGKNVVRKYNSKKIQNRKYGFSSLYPATFIIDQFLLFSRNFSRKKIINIYSKFRLCDISQLKTFTFQFKYL